MFTTFYWVLLGSIFVPMVTLLAVAWILRGLRSLRRERPPITDKLLRSPGESLRREIEKMDEHINDILIWTFFGPAVITAFLVAANPGVKLLGDSAILLTFFFVVVAIVFSLLVWRLIYLINRRRDYRLGFAGERAVAEELNQLMLDGRRVFHDVPMEPYGNIDHVLVAPTGVYAVETKVRRKRQTVAGKRDYKVVFDGEKLQFPEATDLSSLHQARQQADRLRAFLSSAVGESVEVQAILTFPGWFVINRAKAGIKVLNPKEIRAAVVNSRLPTLSKQLNERIAHQLDQKCRDIEF
jgi:Nuclease-related domain